jgi:hypothetical protein
MFHERRKLIRDFHRVLKQKKVFDDNSALHLCRNFFLLPQPFIQVAVSEHTNSHHTHTYLDLLPISRSTRTRLRDLTVTVHPCEAFTILKIIREKSRWATWDEQASNSRPAALRSPLEHSLCSRNLAMNSRLLPFLVREQTMGQAHLEQEMGPSLNKWAEFVTFWHILHNFFWH